MTAKPAEGTPRKKEIGNLDLAGTFPQASIRQLADQSRFYNLDRRSFGAEGRDAMLLTKTPPLVWSPAKLVGPNWPVGANAGRQPGKFACGPISLAVGPDWWYIAAKVLIFGGGIIRGLDSGISV